MKNALLKIFKIAYKTLTIIAALGLLLWIYITIVVYNFYSPPDQNNEYYEVNNIDKNSLRVRGSRL